ncbi:uncharacterized protein LOC135121718 [Zophobas morio]|uniref:uncharacterized protein LOC135121718 n=1 Tax=Zophobas morio TaxID=2755281 RepID=UPI003082DC5A
MIIPVAFNSGNTEQKFTTVDGQCDWLKSIIEVSIEKAKDYLKGETVQQKKDNLVKELNNLQKLSQIPADNWCSYYMECCELLFCFEEPLPLRTSLEFYFHQLKEKRRAACDGVISHSLLQMASLSHHEKNSPVMNHLCSSEDPYTALVSIVLSEFPLMSVPVYLLELEQKSIAYKCRISSLNEVLEKLCKLYAAFSTDSTLRSFSDPPLERLVAKLPSLAPEWLSQYVFTKEFALASTLCDFQLLLNGVNPLTFEFYGVNTEEDSASSESSLPSECMKILSDSSKKSEEVFRESNKNISAKTLFFV